MKIFILAVCLIAFGCKNKEDEDLKKAKELIEQQKKIYTADSLAIERQMELEAAKARLKDTLK